MTMKFLKTGVSERLCEGCVSAGSTQLWSYGAADDMMVVQCLEQAFRDLLSSVGGLTDDSA